MTCQFHGSDKLQLWNSVPNPTAITKEGEWLPAKSHNTKGRGGSECFNSEGQPQEPVAPSNGSCRTKTKKNIFLNTVFSHHIRLPSAPLMVAKSLEKSSAMADDIYLHKIFGQGLDPRVPLLWKSQTLIPFRVCILPKPQPPKPGLHFLKQVLLVHFTEWQPPEFALSRGVIQYILTPHQIIHQIFMNLTTLIQIILQWIRNRRKFGLLHTSWVPKRVLKVSEIADFFVNSILPPPSSDRPISDFANSWHFKPSRPNTLPPPADSRTLWHFLSTHIAVGIICFFPSAFPPSNFSESESFCCFFSSKHFSPGWQVPFSQDPLHFFLTATTFQLWRLQTPPTSHTLPVICQKSSPGSPQAQPWPGALQQSLRQPQRHPHPHLSLLPSPLWRSNTVGEVNVHFSIKFLNTRWMTYKFWNLNFSCQPQAEIWGTPGDTNAQLPIL